MAARNRVVAALNFITGEGVDYYPDNCNEKDIGVLISDYFEHGNDDCDEIDCESADESNHRNEGGKLILVNNKIHNNYKLYREYTAIHGRIWTNRHGRVQILKNRLHTT